MKRIISLIVLLFSVSAFSSETIIGELNQLISRVETSSLSKETKEIANEYLNDLLDFNLSSDSNLWYENEEDIERVRKVISARNGLIDITNSKLSTWREIEISMATKLVFCRALADMPCIYRLQRVRSEAMTTKRTHFSLLMSFLDVAVKSLPTFVAPIDSKELEMIEKKNAKMNDLLKNIEKNKK